MLHKRLWLILFVFCFGNICFAAADRFGEDKANIVNIINYIRAVEPRCKVDLYKPVVEQLKLIQSNNLKATWLLQYDALIEERFSSLLKAVDSEQEIGIWFEVVQQLVEKAGLQWRGRWSWDWHPNVGFLVGYSPLEREMLIDASFSEFKKIFGYTPRSVGSWLLDAHSLKYMADKYGVDAFCICKEQSGTDGYTLWGGYYNHGYYPSKNNAICPAQRRENQINVPVFRMLGADPIYQYNAEVYDYKGIKAQRVYSLEPVYPKCGGDKGWIKWYFNTNVSKVSVPFGYIEVGQENSFGWERMRDGYIEQVRVIADGVKNGSLRLQTLGETGRWFKERFSISPAVTYGALTDWQNKGNKSIWYYNRFYRVNVYACKEGVLIRDLMLYSDDYRERYMADTCKGTHAIYDALPVMDGFLWADGVDGAGIAVVKNIKSNDSLILDTMPRVTQIAAGVTLLSWETTEGNKFEMELSERGISLMCDDSEWCLVYNIPQIKIASLKEVFNDYLLFRHNGFDYRVAAKVGNIEVLDSRIALKPENGKLLIEFPCR
jgi:hypothetical protein